VATVKNHVHNILEKLKVSRRGDAAARLRVVEGGLGTTGPRPGPALHRSEDSRRRVPLA
jgi:hypothetical protein